MCIILIFDLKNSFQHEFILGLGLNLKKNLKNSKTSFDVIIFCHNVVFKREDSIFVL